MNPAEPRDSCCSSWYLADVPGPGVAECISSVKPTIIHCLPQQQRLFGLLGWLLWPSAVWSHGHHPAPLLPGGQQRFHLLLSVRWPGLTPFPPQKCPPCPPMQIRAVRHCLRFSCPRRTLTQTSGLLSKFSSHFYFSIRALNTFLHIFPSIMQRLPKRQHT